MNNPSVRPFGGVRVSAIVSLYRASRFLHGCLDALVRQTLFRRGEMEILCRDAQSPENEAEIIAAFSRVYPNIDYAREDSRVPLYESWNRATLGARGAYLLAASADDRLEPQAAEVLATALDRNPDCDVAYADWIEVPAEQLDELEAGGLYCRAGEFSHLRLLRHFFLGSQPMWRRDAHQRVGGFDTTLSIVSDHDFILRLTRTGRRACRVPFVLGRVGRHNSALSASRETARELDALFDRWLTEPELVHRVALDGVSAAAPELAGDLAAHALCAWPPWRGGALEMLTDRIDRAAELAGEDTRSVALVFAARACLYGDHVEADAWWSRLPRALFETSATERYLHPPLPVFSEPDAGWTNDVVKRPVAPDACWLLGVRKYWEHYFGRTTVEALLERAARTASGRSIVIWGAGVKGGLVAGILRSHQHPIHAFVDSRANGWWAGCPVVAPSALTTLEPRPLVVVSLDPRAHDEVLAHLDALNHPPDLIVRCPES
ncbi:MAG: glycosyltransferase [Opitutaceae bacterium]